MASEEGPGDAYNLCWLMIDATHLKARTKGGPNYKLPAVADGLTGRGYPHRLCGLKSRRVSRIWPGFCRVRREWRVPAGISNEHGVITAWTCEGEAPRKARATSTACAAALTSIRDLTINELPARRRKFAFQYVASLAADDRDRSRNGYTRC